MNANHHHPDSLPPGRVVAVHRTLEETDRTVSRLRQCRFPASEVQVRPRALTFVEYEPRLDLRVLAAVLAGIGGGALAGGLAASGAGALAGGTLAALAALVIWLLARRSPSHRSPDAKPAGYVLVDSFEVVVPERYAADALKVLAASRRDAGRRLGF